MGSFSCAQVWVQPLACTYAVACCGGEGWGGVLRLGVVWWSTVVWCGGVGCCVRCGGVLGSPGPVVCTDTHVSCNDVVWCGVI